MLSQLKSLAFGTILALSFSNALLNDIPNREYSNLVFSSVLGLCPKSPVKYSYFSKRSLEYKADVLASSLPKS